MRGPFNNTSGNEKENVKEAIEEKSHVLAENYLDLRNYGEIFMEAVKRNGFTLADGFIELGNGKKVVIAAVLEIVWSRLQSCIELKYENFVRMAIVSLSKKLVEPLKLLKHHQDQIREPSKDLHFYE